MRDFGSSARFTLRTAGWRANMSYALITSAPWEFAGLLSMDFFALLVLPV